jgi:hypothetical protein
MAVCRERRSLNSISRRKIIKAVGACALAMPQIMWKAGSLGCDEILQLGDSNSYAGVNADGTPSFDPTGLDAPTAFCLEYRSARPNHALNSVCVAESIHPFDIYPDAYPAAAINGIGPGLSFMKAYKAGSLAPGRNVRITVQGVGGSGLVTGFYAAPGGVGYVNPTVSQGLDLAIARINYAIAQDSRNAIKAILWTTGANDAINLVDQADYEQSLGVSAAYLRANITGGSNVPFLVEGLVGAWVRTNETDFGPVQAALAAAPTYITNCGYADTSDATGQTASLFHLNAVDQRTTGGRFYTALAAL